MSCSPKRTVCVYRVSKKELWTENQQNAMSDFRKQSATDGTISEKHIVGSSWKKQIPEINELILEIEAGRWTEVVFWRVCRSGRNHEMDCKLWNTCVKHGVTLRYLDDRLSSDNEDNRTFFYMLSIMAERERLNTSKRTKDGLRWRMEKYRKENPGKQLLIGKKKGDMWHQTVKAIPAVRALLTAGMSYRYIEEQTGVASHTISKIKKMTDEEVAAIKAKYKDKVK